NEMPNPPLPRAVVGDSAEARKQIGGGLDVAADKTRLTLVNHRLVEARSPTPRLIDDVARHAVSNEIGIPAFAAVRRRLEAGTGVRRAVHHDDRPPTAVLLGRNLELHV